MVCGPRFESDERVPHSNVLTETKRSQAAGGVLGVLGGRMNADSGGDGQLAARHGVAQRGPAAWIS